MAEGNNEQERPLPLSDEEIDKLAVRFWEVGQERIYRQAGKGLLIVVGKVFVYVLLALAVYGASHGYFSKFW